MSYSSKSGQFAVIVKGENRHLLVRISVDEKEEIGSGRIFHLVNAKTSKVVWNGSFLHWPESFVRLEEPKTLYSRAKADKALGQLRVAEEDWSYVRLGVKPGLFAVAAYDEEGVFAGFF